MNVNFVETSNYLTCLHSSMNIIRNTENFILKSSRLGFISTWLPRMSTVNNPVEQSIRNKLSSQLEPHHVEVINESYMHNVPKGSETHFKVLVVADTFNGMPLLKRHRLVNSILEEELKNGVHALSIVAKTKDQWKEDEKVQPSPNCRGGFGL